VQEFFNLERGLYCIFRSAIWQPKPWCYTYP